jgi:tetratricopeptide (TPR) repeat protein
MAAEQVKAQISNAWRTHQSGNAQAAISEFEQILKQDQGNLDALYGLGLAQRKAGDKAKARSSFESALKSVDEAINKRLAALGTDSTMARSSIENDHNLILQRMLKQRLTEMNGSA